MKNLKTTKSLANLKAHQLSTKASDKVKGGSALAVPTLEGACN